jgi:hypothetical protein
MNWKANAPVRGHGLSLKLPCGKKAKWQLLFRRHQPFPGTPKCQLDSEGRRQKQIDLACFDFLKVARGNLGAFGQFFLSPMPANALTPHIRAENLDSFPFFFGNCHDILHRFPPQNVNDTYIVKKVLLFLKELSNSNVLVMEGIT